MGVQAPRLGRRAGTGTRRGRASTAAKSPTNAGALAEGAAEGAAAGAAVAPDEPAVTVTQLAAIVERRLWFPRGLVLLVSSLTVALAPG